MPTTSVGFDDGGGVLGGDSLVRFGPTIYVQIGFDPSYRPQPLSLPNLPSQSLPALIDTGAYMSCIDSQLAAALQLPVIDRQIVSGVHGAQEVNVHLGQIYIPSLGHTVYGEFHGVHLQAGGQPHFALIGRLFLRNFVMNYDGRTGSVTISS